MRRMLPTIDLEELLHGSPTWQQVVEFWRGGEFHEEQYLVEAIKRHLRSKEHQQLLAEADISIEMMLNGRIGEGKSYDLTQQIFADWNKKLGFKAFGF